MRSSLRIEFVFGFGLEERIETLGAEIDQLESDLENATDAKVADSLRSKIESKQRDLAHAEDELAQHNAAEN